MAARPCNPDSFAVELDVDAGEYLRFDVTFGGGSAKFSVANGRTAEIILDESMGPRQGPFGAEWPREGQSVDRGVHPMAFAGIFLPAARYTFEVRRCRENGSTISVVKRCTFRAGEHFPFSSFDAHVLDEEEA